MLTDAEIDEGLAYCVSAIHVASTRRTARILKAALADLKAARAALRVPLAGGAGDVFVRMAKDCLPEHRVEIVWQVTPETAADAAAREAFNERLRVKVGIDGLEFPGYSPVRMESDGKVLRVYLEPKK